MQLSASAPGKLILLGEYAVLAGAPALVMAVDRRARVTITSVRGNSFSVVSPTLNAGAASFELTADGRLNWYETDEAIRSVYSLFDSVLTSLIGASLIEPTKLAAHA